MAISIFELARRVGVDNPMAQGETSAPEALTPEQLEEGKRGYEKYLNDAEGKGDLPAWAMPYEGDIVTSRAKEQAFVKRRREELDRFMIVDGVLYLIPNSDLGMFKPSDDWTEDERNEFGYIYATEGWDKAKQFAVNVNDKSRKEENEKIKKAISDFSTQNVGTAAISSIASVLSAPMAIVDYGKQLAESAKYGRPVSQEMSLFTAGQTSREAIGTKLNEYGTIDDNVFLFGGKGWGDVYGLGMSIADSAVSGVAFGQVGTLVNFFGQSASRAYTSAYERGASNGQALLYSVLMGAAEAIPEMLSVDKLLHIGKDAAKSLFREVLEQAGQEAGEETLTSLLNLVIDKMVFGQSDIGALANQYMASGMSREEAIRKAWIETFESVAFDAVSGAVSGGVSGGAFGVGQNVVDRAAVNPVNKTAKEQLTPMQSQMFEEGASITDAASRKTIDRLAQKVEDKKTLSGYELRQLSSAVTEGRNADTTEKVRLAIANRLLAKGENGKNIPALTDILLNKALGRELSPAQKIRLKNSVNGKKVSAELDIDNMLTGNFDSEWAIDAGINTIRDTSEAIKRYTERAEAETEKAEMTEMAQAEAAASAVNLSAEAKSTLRQAFTGQNRAYVPQSENTRIHTDEVKTTLNEKQTAQLRAIEKVANALGVETYIYESELKNGVRSYTTKDGAVITDNGYYDPKDKSVHIDLNAGENGEGTMLFTASHELVHWVKDNAQSQYESLQKFVIGALDKEGISIDKLVAKQIANANNNGREMSEEEALEEVIADACMTVLTTEAGINKVIGLKTENRGLWNTLKRFFTNRFKRIDAIYKGVDPDSDEGKYLGAMHKEMKRLTEIFAEGAQTAAKNAVANNTEAKQAKTDNIAQVDTTSESVAPVMHSYRTWTESEYVTQRQATIERVSKALGIPKTKVAKYIDDVNSIAKMIADDRARLDYEASSFGSAFVSNVEYGGSFDYTTLCKKRRIYTGTFSEIQKRLGDVALTPDDILEIRNLMIAEGIEATCGLCYVEGSRANMGKFAKEFIRLYKRDNPDAWTPTMVDVNTPDGVEQMRINHPDAYEQYEYFWNHYGKLKDSDPALFASQQKPKLYEARKEYKGEILKHFKGDMTVAKKNLNGGIRMQSFSDFEIVHLIDTMQVIMDMSTVGLAGQAYTKVPEFAQAFGGTGLKINLSLIAKGVDADGNLIFDDREGMPAKTAFELRDKYSENVGTIIVAFTDEQVFAAMADDRIDFIIPFHRSQWKKGQYGAMGLPQGTKDYTNVQNEKLIKPTYHEYRGRMVKDKATNYMPNEYWDFTKSGKENAEAYLEMCAKNNKRPKFYKFLDYDGNGKYSLKADGSTDGYWKLLIDFKMYDNNGVGSPQRPVMPDFNMDESIKMLNEYRGGHSSYPVANSVVDKFVESYNGKKEIKHSGRKKVDSNGNGLSAEQQEFFKDSKVRDKKGNLLVLYHGTTADFSTFKKGDVGFHFGAKGAARGRVGYGKNTILKEVYLNITNPIVFDEDLGSWDADYRLTRELYDMGILTQEDAESVLFTDDRQYRRTTEKANKKLAEVLLSKGYDGIAYENTFEGKKTSTSYIVFNSNQAKEIANKTPTSNPDIRYSGRKKSSGVDIVNNSVYNELYTSTKKFAQEVDAEDREAFARKLANKTADMSDGEYKLLNILCGKKQYTFSANGYMVGEMISSRYISSIPERSTYKAYEYELNTDTKIVDLWDEQIRYAHRQQASDISELGGGRGTVVDDSVSADTLASHRARDTERIRTNSLTPQELDRILTEILEQNGMPTKIGPIEVDKNAIDSTDAALREALDRNGIKHSSRKKRTVSTDSLPFVSDTAGMIVSDISEAYEPTKKDKLETAVIASQIAFTNAQAGIEAIAKKYGIKNMESLVQAARVASHQAEEMIVGNQYRIGSDSKDYMGEGLQKIIQPIEEQGEEVKQAFFDYLFHQHNADRMSLERRSIEWNEETKAELTKQMKRFAELETEWNTLKAEREKVARKRSKAAERNKIDARLAEINRERVAVNKVIRKLRKQVDEFVPLKNKPVLALNRDQIEARRAEIAEQIEQLEAERKELGRKKANASRVTVIKAEIASLKEEAANLSAEVTEEQSRKIIEKYEKAYPDFVEVAEKIWKYNANLNQYRVDTGLITQDAYDYMQKLYPHYVPSYRDGESTGIAAVKGKNNIAVNKTVKSATGSTRDLLNPIVIMARQTMETVRAGRINQIATALFDAAGNDKTYLAEVSRKKVSASELVDLDPTELRPKGNQVTFYKDGKRVVMQVSSELFAGFDAFSPQVDIKNPLLNGVAKANDIFKRLVTSANPIFLLRNSIRDFQDAGLNTKYPTKFLKNYARAIKIIAENGELWNLYKAMGGSNQSYFDFDKGFKMEQTKRGFAKGIKPGENATKMQKTKAFAGDLLAKMESANAYVEALPRFAEFISSIEAGNTAEQAMLDAADVTTNFARTGKITKALNNTVIPFLNPAIQGASKAIRNVTSIRSVREALILAAKATIVGIAPYLLNALLYGDDEDYESLRETDKENNHLIKVGDIFIKLPRGRMASVLAGLFNRSGKTISGEDADWAGYLKNASTQMNPFENMARTIFSPFLDVANNVTWYGSAIEGKEFENKSPKDRYDENTSAIAIAIGKVINYSPKKIHYLIDQYSGVIGDFLLPATTKKAEKDFLSGNLTIDPVMSNKLSDNFYDIYYEAQYAKSADANNKTAEYQVKHLNRVKSAISDLFDEKSRIQSSDLSDREKLDQTRAIQVLINKAYKTAIDDYELVTKAIEATSSVDDKYRYAEITRLVYGADAALEVYDEKVYEKSKVMKKAGISANVFYKYYFSTADIKSDKDKNGDTISGSKKKKILKEIDKLKLPKEKRLLLIASSGYSLSADEDAKLIRYINSLKISANERIRLAEICGYEVKNGKIVNKG